MRPNVLIAVAAMFVILAGFVSEIQPPLTEQEKEGILLMREEEKMAYEVYSAMYRKWEHHVFNNISQSESFHVDIVKDLITKYRLEDPAFTEEGRYKNETLQKMYNDLVKKGENSLTDAFEVGAVIEDLDIRDLEKMIDQTKNKDLKEAYETLLTASRNHLRAFTRQLSMRDKPYQPAYLTKEAYEKILAGEHEQCNYKNPDDRKRRNNGKCCSENGDSKCSKKGNLKSCGGNQEGYCCNGRTGKKACAGRNTMN